MRQTVVLCDLHDESAVASTSVEVHIDAAVRRLDVCAEHAAWLLALPEVDESESDSPIEQATTSRPPTRIRTASRAQPRGAAVMTGPGVRAGSRRSLRAERAAARDWARTQGREVADRGRLPTGLLELYRAGSG